MIILLLILVASFSLCIAVTPLVRQLAIRAGLVDRPDGRRKLHERPIPVAGGLAVLVTTVPVIAAGLVLSPGAREAAAGRGFELLGLLLGALAICAVGVADDFGRLRARYKLLGQIVAAGLVMSSGVVVHYIQIFGWHVELGLLAAPFTLFFLLGAINSLNLIDGMDGLLGSVGVITCMTLAAMAVVGGDATTGVVAAALAGALLGFLRYNFPPASIFLGDCGSMLVGLVVGTLAIQSSLKAPATIVLSTPLALLALPLFDTTAAIVRRKLTGRSIYSTDRGHLHHCLLRRGLSTRCVLLVVSTCSVATGLGVLASQAFNNEWIALLTGLAVISILVLTGLFGYAEAMLIKERLLALGSSIMAAGRQQDPYEVEVRLQGSLEWKELWCSLTATAGPLNLKIVRLDVNAPAIQEGYHAHWEERFDREAEVANLWRAEIPLSTQGIAVGRLELTGQHDGQPVWMKLAEVTRVLDEFASSMDVAAAQQCPPVAAGAPAPPLALDVLPVPMYR